MAHTLSEFESKALLREAGVPVPEEWLVDDVERALCAAETLGYPVAVKLCGPGIAHKTERDLVRLGLASPESVAEAAQALLDARRPDDGPAGLLVAPMVPGRRELIAGLVRDAQFGPCVMLGLGGVFAEAFQDVAFAAAPLLPGDAEDLIGALRHAQLLGPFRGEPPLDRAALARVLEALGELALARPDVRAIDLNPLIVRDGVPVAVDALVELEGERA